MITMPKQLSLCKKIAEEAHKGQFRKDGITPYITHPIAVAEMCRADFAKCIALLHDVLEDTDETVESLRLKGVEDGILCHVELLSKSKNQSYDDYINNLIEGWGMTEVKIFDIIHNLSDDPSERQKEKYLKALGRLIRHAFDCAE